MCRCSYSAITEYGVKPAKPSHGLPASTLFGYPVRMDDSFPPIGDVEFLDPVIRLKALQFKPAQPHLVPVRKGGPWQVEGKWCEVWRNGEYVDGADRGFVIVDGDWRYAPFTPKHPALSGIALRVQAGDELRPKKDWTGDLPEGTRLATDFVVGQRVRCDKTEGHIVERDEQYCTEGTIPVRWPTHTAYQMDPNRLEGY